MSESLDTRAPAAHADVPPRRGALALAALLFGGAGIALWRSTTAPAAAVAALCALWVAAWCALRAVVRTPRRTFALRAMAVHLALGLCVLVLEAGTLAGVDYRLVLRQPVVAPSRDPHYVPDDDMRYVARPGWRTSGDRAPGNIAVICRVPDPEEHAFDVAFDARGFRNPEPLEQADAVLVGDSMLLEAYVPEGETVPALLRRGADCTAYSLAHTGWGPGEELAALRRVGLGLRPRAVVWFFYEGNDLSDLRVYQEFVADRKASFRERHGFVQRSFTHNALERIVTWIGKPRPDAAPRSGRLVRDGVAQNVYFMQPPQGDGPYDGATFGDLAEILRAAHGACSAADAEFVVAFVPQKFRALGHLLTYAPDSEAASWKPTDVDERLEHAVRSLGAGATYVDLTPALRRQAEEGELPYFRDDTHLSVAGCAAVGAALVPVVRAALAAHAH